MGKTNPKYQQIEGKLAKTVKEKPPKNPRVPTFPPAAEATAQKLREIIDDGGERATMAYAALSRLSVLWTDGAVKAEPARVQIVHDLIRIMVQLFPNGDGLPDPDSL